VPTGSIISYAGTQIPSGWLVADGRPLLQANYPQLYNAIGTAHGSGLNESGVQVGDFNLPDLRGRFLRGVDQSESGTVPSPAHDPDALQRAHPIGNSGNDGNRVGSLQADATRIPSSVKITPAGSHDGHWTGGVQWVPFGNNTPVMNNPNKQPAQADHTHQIVGGDAETRPTNVAVYFLICSK
jgi:hypothetical protein